MLQSTDNLQLVQLGALEHNMPATSLQAILVHSVVHTLYMIMAHAVHYHRVAAATPHGVAAGDAHSQSMHPHMKCTLCRVHQCLPLHICMPLVSSCCTHNMHMYMYLHTRPPRLSQLNPMPKGMHLCGGWHTQTPATVVCAICHHVWHTHCSLALTHVWHPDTSTHLAAVALCTMGCAPPAICACCIPTRKVGWPYQAPCPTAASCCCLTSASTSSSSDCSC
jgi:hypothetical protein